MSFKLKSALQVALASAFLAPVIAAAAPAATLYGGGATLPADAYVGDSWLVSPNDPNAARPVPLRLTNPADLGSLFGAYTAATPAAATHETAFPAVSYCQTGSGSGRAVFLRRAANPNANPPTLAYDATVDCGTYGDTSTRYGFSGANSDPNFSATDAPLSSGEYNEFFLAASGLAARHTEPVQIPSIAGAIGVVFTNTDIVDNPTTTTKDESIINLTESQICGIFSGSINNWSQLGYPSRAIRVVYRSDGSGTSFNFSNHLSAVCPTTENPISGFSTQSTFLSAFPGGSAGAPANSIASSGNGGVVTSVQATNGSVGYAEIADAIDRSRLNGGRISYATVSIRPDSPAVLRQKLAIIYKKNDPTKLAASYKIPTGSVATDMVIGANTAGGRPTLVALPVTPAQAGCTTLVDPNQIATAATKAYVKNNPDGSQTPYSDYLGYPIVAVTYLLAYNTGNGDDTYNIENLIASPYNAVIKKNVTTAGKVGTGFAFLTNTAPVTAVSIKNCISP